MNLKDLKDGYSADRTSSGVRLCWELEEPKAGLAPYWCVCGPVPRWSNSHARLRIPFSRLPRSSVQGGLMPRSSVQGGLMWSERKHGLSTEQLPVSAYVGGSKNLKDLMDS